MLKKLNEKINARREEKLKRQQDEKRQAEERKAFFAAMAEYAPVADETNLMLMKRFISEVELIKPEAAPITDTGPTLEDVGMDSRDIICLLMALEEVFDTELPDIVMDSLGEKTTLWDLFRAMHYFVFRQKD